MMTTHRNEIETEMVARLERLACGELDESACGPLLAWLEEEPLRWRLCGLAFLEAQSWAETLAVWPAPSRAGSAGGVDSAWPIAADRRETPRQPTIDRSSARSRRLVFTLVAAASLLIAFGLGLGTRGITEWTGGSPGPRTIAGVAGNTADRLHGQPPSPATISRGAVLASLPVRSESGLGPVATVQVPVVPGDSTSAIPHPEIPEYVRDQWERRGYRLSTQRRYLFAHLPDGREAVVPVEQVFVHPIPRQVY
jgi:hypothetical protein